MNKSLKVLFFLRTRTSYVSGPAPIYIRVTVDGDRFEMATQRVAEPEKWNNKAGRMARSTKESTRELNYYLDMLQGKVFEAQREMLTMGMDITAVKVKNFLLGKDLKDTKTLLEVYNQHVEEVKALVGKEYAQGTLKRFKAALTSLEAYLKHKGVVDISLDDLNHLFITGYEFFLKSVRNMEHNTAMGTIKKLKKIVRLCVANEWIGSDPFMSYKVKIRETNRPFLLQDEMCIFRPSFAPRIITAASHEAELELGRAIDGIIGTALKIPKSLSGLWRIIPLKTLLDAYGRGGNLGAANEPPAFALATARKDMVDRELKEERRKKRRGLRR